MSRLSRCPDYQGVLIIKVGLHTKGYFGTITKCPGVLINRFHELYNILFVDLRNVSHDPSGCA